jgi:hypothetical protein
MGIWDPTNQFPGDAAYAINGWLASWKARPLVAPIDPWWRPGDLTYMVPGAKLVSRAPIPIHRPGLQPWKGSWEFSENTGLYITCRRAMWQKGTKVNMMIAGEFDVGAFDMSPETMGIEIGNNPALALVSILNGCYSGTAQDASANVLPAQLHLTALDQVYGQGKAGTNGAGTLCVKSGDTGNYKPVNPGDTTIGSGWFNGHENFDFQNAQSYIPVLENMATRKAMNNVELGLAQGNGLELWINFQNYERTRLLMEVFQELAQSGIVNPYVYSTGVNTTAVNSLVESFNNSLAFGTQKNPVFGRMKVRGVTGLRTDLAVIVAPKPPTATGPETSLFIHAQGGKTGQWANQTNPAAMQADTVPHIAVFPWTETTGPMFFGTNGNSAGDIGLSMVVNEGFAAVSGILTEFLFSGSAS